MQLRKLTYFGRMTAGITSWLRLALLLLCVSVSGVLLADRWVNTQYNTTEGNEFYITAMKNAGASEGDNANLKVYLYATSRLKTQIRVVSNDGKFDKKITIPEGGQQGLDIPLEYVYADCASNIDASVSVAEMFDVTENQNKSLHVYACDDSGRQDTTKRFSLYITNLHKKAGYEATNVLPVEALERAYMVQTYHDDVEGTEFAIVATENNQIFELKLKLAEYDTTDGLDTVISKTITIAKKGQVRVVGVTNADYSLSGTTICSNAKFVLVNGNQLAQIPNGVSNHTFEQSISADKWGREYVVTPTSEHSTDYVLLTALEDNTVVKKDGAVLTTMNSGETYTDILTNNGSIAPYYTSNKNILCYLYKTTKANNGNSIRPTMTSISPMNAGLHSIIIAAFNATATDLNLKPKEFVEIKNHFINIVTEAKYKDEIYIDKEKITGFKPVPANNNFYYCIYKIPNTGSDPAYKKPHVLSCKNPQGTFTVRMYGHEGDFSYAYNAGFRVNRKVDMLINDQYLDTLEICKEEEVKLTSIIGFDYESIDWCIKSRDAGNREQFTDSIIKYNFTTDSTKTTIYDVQLAVTSKMPDICDECQSCDPMYLRDTVSAIVIVKNSVNEYVSQNVCLNDAFSATAYGGTKVYNYIADTTIWQPQPYKNEKVKLKVNTIFEVRDTLRRTNGCDSIIVQRFIVRLPDTTSLDTSICDNQLPFVWKYNEGRNSMTIDTIKGKELVIKREVAYNNKYGCPSMATLNLHVYPTHKKVDNVVICQEPKGNKYKWNGHEGHIVYDVKNKKRINANDIPADVQGTYTYIDSLKTGCNDCPKCDSIVELNLTILDNIVVPIYDTICDNELPYSYPGIDKFQNLTQSGEYRETFTSKLSGCDSVVVLYLQVNNRTTYDTTIYHCENHLPFVDPHTQLKYYTSTKYSDTITNVSGCDSIIRVNFVVTDTFHTHIDTVICESYSPYNHPDSRAIHLRGLTQSGVYYDTIPTHQYGCDSILILNLTINPLTTCYRSVTWCLSSGPYNFPENPGYPLPNLQGLTESKTYRDTLYGANQYGCDSIIELDLTILETIVTPLYDSICDNELPYNHPSMDKFRNLTHTGEYSDTLTSKLTGCDSIVVLHLQVNKTYNTTDTITICASEGSPYIWRPSDMNGPQEIAIPFEIDDRVNVKDKQTLVLNDSSVLLQSVHGCDSLVNLCLIVHPTYELVEVDTVDCQDTHNKYSTWIDQLGGVHQIDISEAGWITIAENPGTIYGCDSIIGIKLYVRPTYRYDSVYTICQDERITWQGKTYAGSHYGYNYQMLSDGKYAEHRDSVYYLYEPGDSILEAGVHHDTIVYSTMLGCDSTYYLTLNVLPTSNTILDVSVCDSEGEYVFKTSDKNGTYYDTIPIFPITEMIDSVRKDTAFHMRQRTLKTPDGCDSTVYLHLTVTPTYEYITRAEICATDVYTWRGRDYNKAGVYYNEYRTEQDCDSNYILELAVRPVMFISRTLHACDNQTVMHSDTLWYDPDSIRFAIDSTLLWKPGMQIPDTNECREVHYYTTDGRCDSIIYKYYLHIHPTYDSIANATICSNESYQLHDSFIYTPAVAYHEPGSNPAVIDTLIADTLRTLTCMECEGGGCDSVFRANIRILPAYKHIDSVTICSDDTCFWREKKYNEPIAGLYVYYDSLSTINNCDSIYELHLTVHQAYDHDVFDTICSDEYYHFGDTLLNQTGEYLDTLRTIHDCDSIVHLYLTVLDTTVVITYDTICVTEKYRFFDAIYTEPGSYDTITLNDWGCKQYNYLHLAVIDTTAYNISIGDVLCADDEELWVEYEWISGRRLIEYSVFFDEFGHSQGFEDIIHAPLDPTLSYFAIPIPRGEDLPMPPHAYFDSQQGVNSFINETKQNYPEPNRYTMRVVMHNGICGDSLQRKDTTISFWYPSWIHEQHWNDVIVLYRDTFNGGYQFSNYQWYQNGQPLPGATGEYLYLPEQLLMNQRGDCSNYYQVELTRLSDGYTTMTCPICPVLMKDTIVPQDTYFSVVPTLVPKANPVIHFLASHAGTYTITTLMGNTIVSGEFTPDANNYAGNVDLRDYISATNTILNVKLTLNTGETRTIKVMIGN